ncbi:g9915 [Coccomyxa elongata]
MDTKNHLSRHFLGTQPSVLRSIPFAPAGAPDKDGVALKHRLLALADWNQDSEQHRLSIANLQVRQKEGSIESAIVQELASWVTDGSIKAMEVGDLGGGELVIVAGSSRGHLSRLRLTSPLAPGSDPSEVQLQGEGDMEGADLLPWKTLHRGRVAALDICADTREVVSAGEDGALFVVPLESTSAPQPFVEARASASYRAVRWASQQTFVSAGTTGGLEVWDKRRPGKSQLRSPLSWGLMGSPALDASHGLERQINCIAAHPSRPHLCATGSSSGTVAIWDLRFTVQPAVHVSPKPGSGEVWEVHFDGYEPFSGALGGSDPLVLFCTSGGVLGIVSSSAGSLAENAAADGEIRPSSVLYEEPCSGIRSFDVDTSSGQDIFCATEQECLVYLSRGAGL